MNDTQRALAGGFLVYQAKELLQDTLNGAGPDLTSEKIKDWLERAENYLDW